MYILQSLKTSKNQCIFDVLYDSSALMLCNPCYNLMPFWFHKGPKFDNKQDQYEAEVRVSVDVDICWILYRFLVNLRKQMELR